MLGLWYTQDSLIPNFIPQDQAAPCCFKQHVLRYTQSGTPQGCMLCPEVMHQQVTAEVW